MGPVTINARLIPARAGKTSGWAVAGGCGGAHPRAGGENAEPDGLVDPDADSSPRGRGKHTREIQAIAGAGLIPARAGKTAASWLGQVAVSAHPRAGGEN